jgi:hypothetical protein
MSNKTIDKISQLKSQLAALEGDLLADLAELPGQYGFANADEFIAAFRKAVSAGPVARKVAKAPKAEPKAPKVKAGRKKRVRITPEIEEQVKTLLAEGKNGPEIAKTVGISIPTVSNIKKKLTGGEAPAAAPVAPAAEQAAPQA